MEKYHRNYKGIVIQNDDPKQMGRVKVYVPEVMTTLYKDWNADKEKDKKITYLGDNLGGDISDTLLVRLKKILPWAEVKQPIFGMSTPGTFNAAKNHFNVGNDTQSSVQQNKFNTAVAGSEPSSNGGTTKNIYNSTSETELTKTQDALQALCSETNTTDINNYLNCNAAPPSVSTVDSETSNSECGNAAMGSPIDDFAYVANIFDPTYINLSSSPASTNITIGTNITLPTSNTNTNTISAIPQTSGVNSIKKDNIHSISFSFLPTTNYKSSRNINKALNQQETEEDNNQYNPTIVSAYPATTNPLLTAIAAHAAPIIYTLIRGTPALSARQTSVPILFSPVSISSSPITNKTDSSIKTVASQVSFNGSDFSINNGQNTIIVPKTSVSKINVVYSDPFAAINLASERLGDISQFFQEYSTPAFSVFSQLIIPPASIPLTTINPRSKSPRANRPRANDLGPNNSGSNNSGSNNSGSNNSGSIEDLMDCASSNSGTYNRGGGGSEIFSGVSSDLLPIYNIHNSSIAGANPESKTSVSHGASLPTQNDPNKVSGNNLKNSSIDANPPIIPSTQNNKVKGMVSTPGVGAHVSVYFEQGNPLYPIVDGVFFTREDYQGVHDSAKASTAASTPTTTKNNTSATDNSTNNASSAQANTDQNNAQLTGAQASLGSSVYGTAYDSNGNVLDQTTLSEINDGTLTEEEQYIGAGGTLEANKTVAFNRLPQGTQIKITHADTGEVVNYNNSNPSGIYTVKDTGGTNVDHKIDFYAGNDSNAYNYYKNNVNGINIEVVEYGTGAIKKGRTPLFNNE